MHLALDDCEVFRVLSDGRRERVLTTDFYPMLSVCQRQEVSADADTSSSSLAVRRWAPAAAAPPAAPGGVGMDSIGSNACRDAGSKLG